jgi:peptidyl-prolyl cis-trans isomerase SurA
VKKKTEVKSRLEAQRDAAAQTRLADAREKAAEKAAAKSGKTNVSSPTKVKKVRPEKIRFGQAPRNALPAAPAQATQLGANTPLGGQAPGVAMAAPAESTSISTGTGVDNDENPLSPQTGPRKKTRYTARQADVALAKAKDNAVKASAHVAARPVAAVGDEKVAEQTQAAPLGLQGDTAKKKPAPKRKKGEAKERLQQTAKPVDTSVPVSPTVNPALGGSAVQASGQPAATPATTSDHTTLPSTTPPTPGDPPAAGGPPTGSPQ